VAALLARGAANRQVGETKMNRESSRSHSVFSTTLDVQTTDENGITNILSSHLNLVDLAGAHASAGLAHPRPSLRLPSAGLPASLPA
jgi:kinesin family member 15